MRPDQHHFRMSIIVCIVLSILLIGLPSVDAAEHRRGGSLKIISTKGMPDCMGWPSAVRQVIGHLYQQPCIETLLRWDESGKPAPHLATGWKVAPDKKSITFFLRKGVKFHDGTDFNAQAVKWGLDLFRKSGRADLKSVRSITVIDDYTIRLNLDYFDNLLLTNLCYLAGPIASPTAGKKLGKDAFCFAPVGTGPFKIKNVERNVSIRYERFDGYWQKDKPYLDSIEWRLVKDPMTAIAAFKAGEADVIVGFPLSDAAALKKDDRFLVKSVNSALIGPVGDSANPQSPFAKLKVRQAVSYAIDAQTICKTILHGIAPATNQAATPGSWGYNPKVSGYPYDPGKAKRLLAEAGYPKGFKTRLWCVNFSPYVDVMTAVQGYLKAVSIEVELIKGDFSAFMEKVMKGWKDGMLYVWMGQANPDDTRNLEANLSSRVRYWNSMLKPKELDDLLASALKTDNWDEKVQLTRQYNKLMTDKYCLVNWIFVDSTVIAMRKKIRDTGLFDVNISQWTPENAWIGK